MYAFAGSGPSLRIPAAFITSLRKSYE
jgi:hypothetical protein